MATTAQMFATVGDALAAAVARAKAHESARPRAPKVRFSLRFGDDLGTGLHILAWVPARSAAEFAALDAAKDGCQRLVPWADLDRLACSGQLSAIVDEVVVAAMGAVGLTSAARLQ